MRHCLVLAGGSGTRLWPFSTAGLPKQLVPLLRGRSLLDIAVERATSVVPADQVWLGAGELLRDAVSAVDGLRADRLVVEPSAKDTLPAVALGCAAIAATDPDAVVAVLTADHLIEPLGEFAATLRQAFELAEARDDVLVTFGVVPDAPATGFGYLELGDGLDGEARVVAQLPGEAGPRDRGAVRRGGLALELRHVRLARLDAARRRRGVRRRHPRPGPSGRRR